LNEHEERTGLRGRLFNRKLRGWILDSKIVTNKVPESGREELAQVLYSPRAWLKGEQMDEEGGRLFPWEKLLWGLGAFFRNSVSQFDGRERLWITTYNVNPNHITVQAIANHIWDGINDPMVGQFMDRRPFKDNTYRWLMRINHVVNQGLTMFFMLDLGLTPVQRLVMFGVIQAAWNIFATMAGISDQKYVAGITPLSEERAKLNVWQHTFHKLAYPIANLPRLLQGFIVGDGRYHWTDQRIFITGFAVLMPFALAGGIVNTFLKNRVSFDHTRNAATAPTAASNEPEEKLTVREMFSVLRHNKYLLYWMIANFFWVLIPTFDEWFVWRFLVPNIRLPIVGETAGPGIPVVMGYLSGLPITFLVPFMRQAMNWLGGPKRTLVMFEISNVLGRAAQFFIARGPSGQVLGSGGRIAGFFAVDTVRETIGPIAGLAANVLNFEMLDYVEYKTGVRSEGVNRAVLGFLEKLVKENVATFTGNFFQSWAGVHTIDGDVPHPEVPERFARWALPVWLLGLALNHTFRLIARASFPYKYGQNVEIEAELADRRAAEAQVREELEEETTTV